MEELGKSLSLSFLVFTELRKYMTVLLKAVKGCKISASSFAFVFP